MLANLVAYPVTEATVHAMSRQVVTMQCVPEH